MTTQKKLKLMSYSSYVLSIFAFAVLGFAIFHFNVDSTMMPGIQAAAATDANDNTLAIQKGMAYMGAGFAGTGLLGAGVGQGYAAGKAAEAVARNPEAEAQIRNMLFVGAAIAESSALYALVISIILIFVA